jgi:hypothetical protein
VTGAILRASRTITNAIPISNANAATSAMTIVDFELVVDSVDVVAAVAVVWVGVVCAPSVSSLSAPLPVRLEAADIAAGALAPANARARIAQAQSDTARWRAWWRWRSDTRRAYRLDDLR